MKYKKSKSLIALLCWLAMEAGAAEIAGVRLPDTAVLASGTPLQLNGAGVRRKFFVNVYAAGLYLPVSAHTPRAIYAMDGEKRLLMHFIYDEVSREKLIKAWNEGFRNNTDKDEFARLAPRIEAFNNAFSDVRKGDVVRLDYLPETGTEIWIKEKHVTTIPGADFYVALLRIWLGDDPADGSLKDALLGL